MQIETTFLIGLMVFPGRERNPNIVKLLGKILIIPSKTTTTEILITCWFLSLLSEINDFLRGSAFTLHFYPWIWGLGLLGDGGYLCGDVIPFGPDFHSALQTDTERMHVDVHNAHTPTDRLRGPPLSIGLSLALLLSVWGCCHSLIAVLRGASMVWPDEAWKTRLKAFRCQGEPDGDNGEALGVEAAQRPFCWWLKLNVNTKLCLFSKHEWFILSHLLNLLAWILLNRETSMCYSSFHSCSYFACFC